MLVAGRELRARRTPLAARRPRACPPAPRRARPDDRAAHRATHRLPGDRGASVQKVRGSSPGMTSWAGRTSTSAGARRADRATAAWLAASIAGSASSRPSALSAAVERRPPVHRSTGTPWARRVGEQVHADVDDVQRLVEQAHSVTSTAPPRHGETHRQWAPHWLMPSPPRPRRRRPGRGQASRVQVAAQHARRGGCSRARCAASPCGSPAARTARPPPAASAPRRSPWRGALDRGA